MIFPDLEGAPHGVVDLGRLARERPAKDLSTGKSLYLKPDFMQEAVIELHRAAGYAYSFGGYGEDRRELWRGSYLEDLGAFIHLGVDCNAPAGTRVAAGMPGIVEQVGSDFPEDGGWGTYAVVRLSHPRGTAPIIIAHLDPVLHVRQGDLISARTVIGKVGTAPQNGNWYPHIHLQAFSLTAYRSFQRLGIGSIDGYCAPAEWRDKKRDYPDPSSLFSL